MDRLKKCVKTANDVKSGLQERDIFRDVGLSGPVSLTEALRMDMTCLTETPVTIGSPSTAWWWYVEDFFRPIGRNDVLKLLPQDEEMDPLTDRCFRMPALGPAEGRRTLTESWESFGYTALRKERRSGRLAEKKAFSPGMEVPSAPSTDWLDLPKEFLKTQKNALEICKDPTIVDKLDEVLRDLDLSASDGMESSHKLEQFQMVHPLTQMVFEKENGEEEVEKKRKLEFSSHCLSVGPDDEIAAEILKLQESLFHQMVTNRLLARKFLKASMRNAKLEKKQMLIKEKKENEIEKCLRIIEAHENKMKEKRAAEQKQQQEEEEDSLPIEKLHISKPKPETLMKKAMPLEKEKSKQMSPGNNASFLPVVKPKIEPERKALTPDEREQRVVCDICGISEQPVNLLTCVHCGIHVHQSCYEKTDSSSSPSEDSEWRCLPCRLYHKRQKELPIKPSGLKGGGALSVGCKACPMKGGVYERTVDMKKWIHTVCQLALKETELTAGTFFVKRKCCICGSSKGIVFPCRQKNCSAVFHPSCAKAKGTLVIKQNKKKDKGLLQIESMTCGNCPAEPELKPAENLSFVGGGKEDELPISGSRKKRKAASKVETAVVEDEHLSEGEEASVCMFTRSKYKRQKVEETAHEFKPSTRQQKRSHLTSNNRKKKKKRDQSNSVNTRQFQRNHSDDSGTAMMMFSEEKKPQRITRSRK